MFGSMYTTITTYWLRPYNLQRSVVSQNGNGAMFGFEFGVGLNVRTQQPFPTSLSPTSPSLLTFAHTHSLQYV